jgi:hypothetical protein
MHMAARADIFANFGKLPEDYPDDEKQNVCTSSVFLHFESLTLFGGVGLSRGPKYNQICCKHAC